MHLIARQRSKHACDIRNSLNNDFCEVFFLLKLPNAYGFILDCSGGTDKLVVSSLRSHNPSNFAKIIDLDYLGGDLALIGCMESNNGSRVLRGASEVKLIFFFSG